jgi:hypothetical protein
MLRGYLPSNNGNRSPEQHRVLQMLHTSSNALNETISGGKYGWQDGPGHQDASEGSSSTSEQGFPGQGLRS